MASAAGSKPLQLETVDIHNPDELNFILGHGEAEMVVGGECWLFCTRRPSTGQESCAGGH